MQSRILSAWPALPPQPRDLYNRMHNKLQAAVTNGALETSSYGVSRLLRMDTSSGATLISGGVAAAFDCAQVPDAHFQRTDGGWFAFRFTLVVGRLDSYSCQICFPDGAPPRFLRFDLDSTGKAHEQEGLRCHMHPGANDLRVPAPVLHPLELLDLLLHGLRAEPASSG